MKWFKHMSDASSDEFLARLEDEMGLEAVARWWKMLEAIAIQMDKTDRCYAEYPISKWMTLLSCKQEKKLRLFVKVLENFGKVSAIWSQNILKLECPKLLEFRDEYSRKSGVAPDKVAPDTDTEEERKKESKNITPISPPKKPSPETAKKGSRLALTDLPEEWMRFCIQERPDLNPQEVFLEFVDYWKSVPGQRGLKLDWFATWRNRVRDKKPTNGGKHGNGKQDFKSAARDLAFQYATEELARQSEINYPDQQSLLIAANIRKES
jgi:hypothetical protein